MFLYLAVAKTVTVMASGASENNVFAQCRPTAAQRKRHRKSLPTGIRITKEERMVMTTKRKVLE